jgi:hypothetical protein
MYVLLINYRDRVVPESRFGVTQDLLGNFSRFGLTGFILEIQAMGQAQRKSFA